MIGVYTKCRENLESNKWAHLWEPNGVDVKWYAHYTADGKDYAGWGPNTAAIKFTEASPPDSFCYIVNFTEEMHHLQKVQSATDAVIWYDLDQNVFTTTSGSILTVGKLRSTLKGLGITWTLTKTTHFFSIPKEQKLVELKKLRKLLEDKAVAAAVNPSTYSFEGMEKYLTPVKKPVPKTAPYTWVLKNGVVTYTKEENAV